MARSCARSRLSPDQSSPEKRRSRWRCLRPDGTPGIDDQRVTIALALAFMRSGLGGGEHEAAVLDGARAQQRVPMGFAGPHREGGRHGEERRPAFGERAIQRRKAHVVADREADAAPGQVRDHSGFARLVIGGLAIALATRQIDIEHMDLVVACDHRAVWRDQEGAVDRPLGRGTQCQRADMKVDFQLRRQRAIGFQRNRPLRRRGLRTSPAGWTGSCCSPRG